MAKRVTQDDFVKKATAARGGAFSYHLVDYVSSRQKVQIVCDKGHEFWQTPNNHLRGQSCPTCNNQRRGRSSLKNISHFLEKSKKVHGDAYDYSQVTYVKSDVEVNISCRNGHSFWQTPNAHYAGKGCRLCNMLPLLDKEKFIQASINVHGRLFNYSEVDYIDRNTPVTISCNNGHKFEQEPRTHLKGYGCAKCAGIGALSQEDFISKANAVHSFKYDYSLVVYESSQSKVEIVCNCGLAFKQVPSSHLMGCGCPSCAKSGFDPKLPASVYVLSNSLMTKVGITNRSVIKRVSEINREQSCKFQVELALQLPTGKLAQEIELKILRELREQYSSPEDSFDGYTECFVGASPYAIAKRVSEIKVEFEAAL